MKNAVKIAMKVGLWLITLLACAIMVDAAWGKIEHFEGWSHWFNKWGYGTFFLILITLAEGVGGLLLLIPKTSAYAAILLIGVMAGAFLTVTFQVSDLSSVDPVINIMILAIPLWGWWKKRITFAEWLSFKNRFAAHDSA